MPAVAAKTDAFSSFPLPTMEQQTPRRPNPDQLIQLANWLQSLGAYDEESATITAENAYVAVYDNYSTA